MRLVRFSESGKSFLAQTLEPPTGFIVPIYNRAVSDRTSPARRRDTRHQVLALGGGCPQGTEPERRGCTCTTPADPSKQLVRTAVIPNDRDALNAEGTPAPRRSWALGTFRCRETSRWLHTREQSRWNSSSANPG